MNHTYWDQPAAIPGGLRDLTCMDPAPGMWAPPGHVHNPDRSSVPQHPYTWEAQRGGVEQPAVDAVFYSHANVRRLQAEFEARGLGHPAPWSLKPYMDLAISNTRGEYNAMMHLNNLPSLEAYLARLNKFVLDAAWPAAIGNRVGLHGHLRDMTVRRIPDNPMARPIGCKVRDDPIIHPYWYSMD